MIDIRIVIRPIQMSRVGIEYIINMVSLAHYLSLFRRMLLFICETGTVALADSVEFNLALIEIPEAGRKNKVSVCTR